MFMSTCRQLGFAFPVEIFFAKNNYLSQNCFLNLCMFYPHLTMLSVYVEGHVKKRPPKKKGFQTSKIWLFCEINKEENLKSFSDRGNSSLAIIRCTIVLMHLHRCCQMLFAVRLQNTQKCSSVL